MQKTCSREVLIQENGAFSTKIEVKEAQTGAVFLGVPDGELHRSALCVLMVLLWAS